MTRDTPDSQWNYPRTRAVRTTRFCDELRGAISASGMSLRELRTALSAEGHSVSLATLSAWQSGAREPDALSSVATVDALERILEVADGTLRDLVGEARRKGRRPRFEGLHGFMPARSSVQRMIESLGFQEADDHPHELFVVQRLTLSASSPTANVDFHILVRALRSGRCSLPSIHVLDPDEPNVKPDIIPLNGCRIGMEISWPEVRTYGAELILEDDAAAGALLFCDFRITLSARPQDIQEVSYSVARAARDILVQAEFDDELAPMHCRAFSKTASGETTEQVLVNASNRIQAARQNFGPGLVGLKWEWVNRGGAHGVS